MGKDVPLKISTFLDQKEINVVLDAVERVPAAPIKLAFYAIDERYSFSEIFDSWKPADYKETTISAIAETDKHVLYKFHMVLPEKLKLTCPKCKGQFYEHELHGENVHEVAYLLRLKAIPFAIVLSNSHVQESDFTFSFFDKYYPFMTRIFLRARQLTEILRAIANNNLLGENVYSQDFILKRYYAGKETERHYKKRDFESIFKEAKDKNLWLDNITFRVEGQGRIQLSREGKLQYYDDLIFSDMWPIVNLILERYLESYTLIKEVKERKSRGEIPSVKIVLNEPTFLENEDADQFIQHLANYKQSDLTILSRNGAFLESTIVDYTTGMSMDISVYDAAIITVIPQFQSNIISLINLINHILEDYDGHIQI